jgi:hypothetical protein
MPKQEKYFSDTEIELPITGPFPSVWVNTEERSGFWRIKGQTKNEFSHVFDVFGWIRENKNGDVLIEELESVKPGVDYSHGDNCWILCLFNHAQKYIPNDLWVKLMHDIARYAKKGGDNQAIRPYLLPLMVAVQHGKYWNNMKTMQDLVDNVVAACCGESQEFEENLLAYCNKYKNKLQPFLDAMRPNDEL